MCLLAKRGNGPSRREKAMAGGVARGRAHPGRRTSPGRRPMGQVRVILCALFLIGMAAAPVRAESVVRIESDDEVLSWDPHAAWHLMSINAFNHVYESLVFIGPDLTPQPSLATAWRLA